MTRNGVKRPGRHNAIGDVATFERVHAVLDAHRAGGERSKKHSHYLNGTVHCAVCGKRLGYGKHRNRWGNYYDYYSCLSRVRPTGPRGNPYAPMNGVEDVVVGVHYDRSWLNGEGTGCAADGRPRVHRGQGRMPRPKPTATPAACTS